MIRKIKRNDIIKINLIGKQLYNNFENIYPLEEYINNEKYMIIVNEDETVNAFLIAFNNVDEIELLCVVVDKNYRNKGIGTQLMNYFINNVNKSILLEVSNNNSNAIKLYKNCGFSEIGIRKNYYSDSSDAIIMKLVV